MEIIEYNIERKLILTKYILYLLRWQLSTPVLAMVIKYFPKNNDLLAVIVANLVGGMIFYWVDRLIFKTSKKGK